MDIYIKVEKSKSSVRLRLIKRIRGQKASTIDSQIITSLNQMLAAKSIDLDQALESARKERDRHKEKRSLQSRLGDVNFKLYNDYWAKCYDHRPNIDLDTAKNRLKRALRALEGVPLSDATEAQIQTAVTNKCKNDRQRRVMVSTLRGLLKFIGRTDVVLRYPAKPRSNPRHIDLEDFQQMLGQLQGNDKLVAAVAFGLGARVGEVFALTKWAQPKRAVFIDKQLDRDLEIRDTKNRRQRWVKCIKELWVYVENWAEVPVETQKSLRNERWAEKIKAACVATFPDEPEKHLTFHDLRHCYAIHCLRCGLTMEQVAKALGDSIVVVQEYYTGYVARLDELDKQVI